MERNGTNYSIDHLFNISTSVTIAGRKLYVRTLGDIDDNSRLQWLMAEGVRALKELDDPDSLMHYNYIATLEGATREDQITAVLEASAGALLQQASQEIYVPEEQEANKASTYLDMVQTEQANQQAKGTVEEERQKHFNDLMAALREDEEKKSDEVLLADATNARKNLALNNVRIKAWEAYTLYAAVYADSKFTRRYFSGPRQASEIAAPAQKLLMAAYNAVDVFSQDYTAAMDFLKESPSGAASNASLDRRTKKPMSPGRKQSSSSTSPGSRR